MAKPEPNTKKWDTKENRDKVEMLLSIMLRGEVVSEYLAAQVEGHLAKVAAIIANFPFDNRQEISRHLELATCYVFGFLSADYHQPFVVEIDVQGANRQSATFLITIHKADKELHTITLTPEEV